MIVDEKSVRTLAKLLDETHLTEIEYQVGSHRIRVTRGSIAAHLPSTVVAPPPTLPPLSSSNKSSEPTPIVSEEISGEPLVSPMVGTAYLMPEPGATPFIKVGGSVKKGDTLLIIEAMKVMNPIRAPRDGKVGAILVSNAKPVEFGETLLILE